MYGKALDSDPRRIEETAIFPWLRFRVSSYNVTFNRGKRFVELQTIKSEILRGSQKEIRSGMVSHPVG